MDKDKTPLEMMQDFNPWDMGDGEAHSLSDFPEEVQRDVEGLMWLGHLEEEYVFCGHRFVLRTIKGDEELLASLACKEFNETLGQARAWIWAILGQAITSIDGISFEDICPDLSNDRLQNARARMSHLSGSWYWPLAAFLNARYNELIERQSAAIAALEDLSKGSLHTFTPFVGSSTERGNSEESTQEVPEEALEDVRKYLEADQEDTTDSNSDS